MLHQEHFSQVKVGLDSLGMQYAVVPHLVRGLDYYTRTVFEINHPSLGAQDAIGAGGRYDNLVKELGGTDLSSVGFALGVERVLLASTELSAESFQKRIIYLIFLGEQARGKGLQLLNRLRQENIPADTDYESKSLKGAMRRANDLKAKFTLILGDDELHKNIIVLKDMQSSQQEEIPLDKVVKYLKEKVIKN